MGIFKSCINCANKEFITDRWENGEIIGSYDACKLDGTILTDTELLVNCEEWKERKVKPIKYQPLFKELKCPF